MYHQGKAASTVGGVLKGEPNLVGGQGRLLSNHSTGPEGTVSLAKW